MPRLTLSRWTLALGLALIFGFFGVDKFVSPEIWIGWLPLWMDGLFGLSKHVWLQITGATEILIAAGLVFPSGYIQRISALGAGGHLFTILTLTGWNEVAVRDIGLLTMALAIMLLPKDRKVMIERDPDEKLALKVAEARQSMKEGKTYTSEQVLQMIDEKEKRMR